MTIRNTKTIPAQTSSKKIVAPIANRIVIPDPRLHICKSRKSDVSFLSLFLQAVCCIGLLQQHLLDVYCITDKAYPTFRRFGTPADIALSFPLPFKCLVSDLAALEDPWGKDPWRPRRGPEPALVKGYLGEGEPHSGVVSSVR